MPPARRNNPKDSLAGAASERVRAIIEAAEAPRPRFAPRPRPTPSGPEREAEERASTLRSEVRADVTGLVGSIREAVNRLQSDLERLQERLGEPEAPAPAKSVPAAKAPARPSEPVGAPEEEDLDFALAEDAAVGSDERKRRPGGSEARGAQHGPRRRLREMRSASTCARAARRF